MNDNNLKKIKEQQRVCDSYRKLLKNQTYTTLNMFSYLIDEKWKNVRKVPRKI